MQKYRVSLPSLREHFPPHFPPPPLLLEFAQWLGRKRWGTLGTFDVESDRSDDWGDEGGDWHDFCTKFLRIGNGDWLAFWLPTGKPLASPPVVLVGHEGDSRVVANSFGHFLLRLARGEDVGLFYEERDPTVADELRNWLADRGITTAPRSRKWPDFNAWMGERLAGTVREKDSNPLAVQVAELVRRINPFATDAVSYHSLIIDVVCVGSRFEFWSNQLRKRPGARWVTEFEQAVRQHRLARATRVPDRGLWFSGFVRVYPTGGAAIPNDFYAAPVLPPDRKPIQPQEYRADLKLFPRSAYWLPKWLKAITR